MIKLCEEILKLLQEEIQYQKRACPSKTPGLKAAVRIIESFKANLESALQKRTQ